MTLRQLLGASLLLLLGLTISAVPQPVRACGAAPPRNKAVQIADESAIIIWDAATKTQHFIRRASFTTNTRDFGFLVPTPTKPTLEPASDEAFTLLAKITEPKVVTRPRPSSGFGCGCSGAAPDRGLAGVKVRVLEEKRVAGLDAVILEADSADALANWLKEHDYEFSPALTKWVQPYVAAGWKISAFRIATDAPDAQRVGTSALRMTFQTERPFFPYREPEEQPQAEKGQQQERLLRVFFLGDSRVQGTLGEQGKAWPGQTAWTNRLQAAQREELLKVLKLPAETPPAAWWLTEFEDHSAPRPGTVDVYFSPAADQAPIERPPHIRYTSQSVPDCLMCYALAAYMVVPCFLRHLRRKKVG